MRLQGVSYESLALDTVVPYALPLAQFGPDREAFDYWWRLLQFTFELPSPYDFPPPSLQEDEALHRYCNAARTLATSACLSHKSSVSVEVRQGDDGQQVEMISFDFPSSELLSGFLALFRQFYSDGELASFAKVRNALMVASKAASDTDADRRLAELKTWGSAHSRLLMYSLKELVGHKLAEQGRFSREGIPDGGKPREIISAFAYGEHLHWGDKRGLVSSWEADQFYGPWNKMRFLEITAGLAYFYMGFAILVAKSLGREAEVAL